MYQFYIGSGNATHFDPCEMLLRNSTAMNSVDLDQAVRLNIYTSIFRSAGFEGSVVLGPSATGNNNAWASINSGSGTVTINISHGYSSNNYYDYLCMAIHENFHLHDTVNKGTNAREVAAYSAVMTCQYWGNTSEHFQREIIAQKIKYQTLLDTEGSNGGSGVSGNI